MPDLKATSTYTISQIPQTNTTMTDADLLETEQSSTSKKVSASVMAAYCKTKVDPDLALKLAIAANLSDVENRSTSTANLGLGSEGFVTLTDATTLSNPCATAYIVNINDLTKNITLPPAQGVSALQVGRSILFVNQGTQRFYIVDSVGNVVTRVLTSQFLSVTLQSNSTANGTWNVSNIDLQQAYNNGNTYDNGNTINLVDGRPFKLASKVAGFFLPWMTDAEFGAIGYLNNGETAWSTDSDRIIVNRGDHTTRVIDSNAYLSDLEEIADNVSLGQMYFSGNSTESNVTVIDTPVDVAATYSASELVNFTHENGVLTYTGLATQVIEVIALLTATYNGSSCLTSFYIAKNGSIISESKQTFFLGGVTPAPQSTPVKFYVVVATGDTVNLKVENNTNTDKPIVQDLNYSVKSIGYNGSGSDITVTGENFVTKSGSVITAHPVNLSNTNVTGVLPNANTTATNANTASAIVARDGSGNFSANIITADLVGNSDTATNADHADTATSADSATNADSADTVPDQAITYAKIQNISTNNRLLGRSTSGAGVTEEITVGSGLGLADGILTASGGGSASVQVLGVMLIGESSYTSGVATSLISTMVGSKIIPADTLSIGQTVEIEASGITGGSGSGGNSVITCKFGDLTLSSSSFATATTPQIFNIKFRVTAVTSTSISVSVAGYYVNSSGVVKEFSIYTVPVVVTHDLSISNTIDILYTMTASGGNQASFRAANLTITKYSV